MNRFWFDDGDGDGDDAAAVRPPRVLVFVAFLGGVKPYPPLFFPLVRWDLITTSLICFVIAYLNTCLLALVHMHTRTHKHTCYKYFRCQLFDVASEQ